MAHDHNTTEDFDGECPRCNTEIQEYYEMAQRAYEEEEEEEEDA